MTMDVLAACLSCGSAGLELILSLGLMPLTDSYLSLEQLIQPEPKYPLDVAFCGACTLVQILHRVPPEEMFDDYQYYSSFSDTLLEHSRLHVHELIASHSLGPDNLVIELASNDGYLLRYFVEAGIPVLGIDPARGPAEAAEAIGVPTLCEYFGVELAERLKDECKTADVVIAKNVLAHVPDLNGFVQGIATVLDEHGVAEIEAPYLRDLIDHLEFDTIYHEHLCYFSVTALNKLFARHGLSLNHVRHLPIHGGSLRLTVGHEQNVSDSVRSYLEDEASTGVDTVGYYRSFSERVNVVRTELHNKVLGLKRSGKRIAAYGAAAKGTILLNSSDIGSDLIDFVVDRNPHKQGLYLPGVHVPIVAPEEILDEMPDYMLLLAWNFKDEVVREQKAYIEAGGRFIMPIPEPVELGEEALDASP
jgi:SAM-dependent methyltransferase